MRSHIHDPFKRHRIMKSITGSYVNISAKGEDKVQGVLTRKPKDDNQYETS